MFAALERDKLGTSEHYVTSEIERELWAAAKVSAIASDPANERG